MSKQRKKIRQVGDYAGWMVPVWATRGASLAVNAVIFMQITYYCTNALGLSPALVGTTLMLSKIFDGITDLVAGAIIDKTNTKLGKARPFELCILGVWIGTAFLFSTPNNLGTFGKLAYIFVFYSLVQSVFATFLNASDAVYLRRAVRSQEGQAKILSLSAPIGIVCCTIVSISLPMLIEAFGDQPGGWTIITGVFAVPAAIIGLGRFFFLKEIDVEETEKKEVLSLKEILRVLAHNKYIFISGLALLVLQLLINIGNAVSTYYFQYIYGDISAAAAIGMISLITPFFLMAFPRLMRKNSLVKLCKIAAVAGIVGHIVKLIAPASMPVLLLGNLITGIAIMPMSMLINIFLIECMDYGEWKDGRRVEGAYSSVTGLASKLGTAVASGVVGIVMEFAKFDSTLAVQAQPANTAIIVLYSVIPAVLFLIHFLILRKYDLDKKIPQIRQELETKRANA